MRPLLLDGTVTNVPLLGTLTGAASMARPRAQWHPGPGPLPPEFYAAARAELGLGFWNLRMALYGSEAVVDARLARVRDAFAKGVPGAEVAARKVPGADVSERTLTTHPERVQAGIPGLLLLDSLQWRGGVGGHLDFSPVAPLAGAHARRLVSLLRPEIEGAGLDFWPGTIMTPRSFYMVSPLLYDTTNEAQVKAAYDVYRRLVRLTGAAGYGLYRGHLEFMDDIAAQYDWGDRALLRLYGTLKDALDPDGILSPGKQGIWPSAMRQS